MPVQLDWEIEDDEAPFPQVVAKTSSQPGSWHHRWRFLAFVALAVVVGLGFLGFKIRQKQKEIENELRAVVELELTALIDGDRDLFLNQQDPDDQRWRRTQEEAFDRHHRQGEQAPWEETPQVPKHTGEIPLVRVEGDQGWALVQVARGEHTWREPWFYRWTPADGWRRVRLDPDWLGEEQRLTTLHLRFTYLERDAAIITAPGPRDGDLVRHPGPPFGRQPDR